LSDPYGAAEDFVQAVLSAHHLFIPQSRVGNTLETDKQ
jgi:hypothetical protein